MLSDAPLEPKYNEVYNISSNDLTLRSYELGYQEYMEGTAQEVSGSFKNWIDRAIASIPPQARIIEIGSGFGRDARYIESFGFKVERTDATEAFVSFLEGEGFAARKFNILTDEFSSQYDLIFANAVFLHLTPQELLKVLAKARAALSNEGILAFTVKKGEGEEWTRAKIGQPRYFCYWSEEKIRSLLDQTEFETIHLSTDEKYLQILAKKSSHFLK